MTKKKTGSFILDLTVKGHPNLKVEICITKTEKDFKRMVELFYSLAGKNPKSLSKTDATFFGYLDNFGGFPDPIGLVILKIGFDTSTYVHELFHVARRYFKMARIRINKEKDEVFAHLLSDLVDEFEKNIPQ